MGQFDLVDPAGLSARGLRRIARLRTGGAAMSWLFLDYDAFFGLCNRVGCRLGLLAAVVVFDLAFAVVDMPLVVFVVDPDR